jgi:Kef-type K+ transport system membrane component KefB
MPDPPQMTSDVSQLGFLLFLSALVAMLSRRLRMPYTVGLVLAGMGLYFFHIFGCRQGMGFLRTPTIDKLLVS